MEYTVWRGNLTLNTQYWINLKKKLGISWKNEGRRGLHRGFKKSDMYIQYWKVRGTPQVGYL